MGEWADRGTDYWTGWMDRFCQWESGKQALKAGVGFPLDRAVGQGSPCSCGETCPCGQGHRCAGKGGSGQGASGYGVLTSYRTLGLP